MRWPAQDAHHITAHHEVADVPIDAAYELGEAGQVRSIAFDPWGDPDRTGAWDWHRFGGTFTSQATFAGLTIPSVGRLGWHHGTERWCSGEFFRYRITDLLPLAPDGGGVPSSRAPGP